MRDSRLVEEVLELSALFVGLAATLALMGIFSVASGVLISCLLGGVGATLWKRGGWLASAPAAAVPLTALSAEYTGFWLLILAVATALALAFTARKGTPTH